MADLWLLCLAHGEKIINMDLHLGGVFELVFAHIMCVTREASFTSISIAAQYTVFNSFPFSFLDDCNIEAFLEQYIKYSSLLSCYFNYRNLQMGLTIETLMCDSLKILTSLLA